MGSSAFREWVSCMGLVLWMALPPPHILTSLSLCRCYSFGIGPNACRRLVGGLAAVSRGIAEFLVDGERLQPKVGPTFEALRMLRFSEGFYSLSWCCSATSPSAAGGDEGASSSPAVRGCGGCVHPPCGDG